MPFWQHVSESLGAEMSSVVGVAVVRLTLAAILGGLIGLEREFKHRPAGLRTNMFICFGAALFTILSDQLQGHSSGDHTRIAAQIIPGIGFIGAGSILHARGDLVMGLTTAATMFVVASIGMAAGGGLYLTAMFATGVILAALFLLGKTERQFNLKLVLSTYEVTGHDANEITSEVNRILESCHALMQNVQVAPTKQHVRVQFDIDGTHHTQTAILHGLRQSSVLESVVPLGPVDRE